MATLRGGVPIAGNRWQGFGEAHFHRVVEVMNQGENDQHVAVGAREQAEAVPLPVWC